MTLGELGHLLPRRMRAYGGGFARRSRWEPGWGNSFFFFWCADVAAGRPAVEVAIDAVAKICRKGAAYAPIRAHYHGMITIFWGSNRRARPHRVPGNLARRARAAADAGIASWRSWCARTRSKAGSQPGAPSRAERPVRRNSVVRDEGTSSRHRGDPADPADTAAAIPRAHHGVN